jgi:hypothetical protein
MQTCILFFNLPAIKRLEIGTAQNTRDFGSEWTVGKPWETQGNPKSQRTLAYKTRANNICDLRHLVLAEHGNKAKSEKRSKDLLYKRFVLTKKFTLALQWWYSQLQEGNYTGSSKDQILDLPNHPKMWNTEPLEPWEHRPPSALRFLGAAFNLQDVIEHAVEQHKESIDIAVNYELTPLLVGIRHGSFDAVKHLLDHGANPSHTSYAHQHHIYAGNMGNPIPDEGMVYWVMASGGDKRLRAEERAKVEEVLLSHERSRQIFLDQTKVHLKRDTHADPCRGVKTLYEADRMTEISAELLRYRIEKWGLGNLLDVLEYIDEESFEDSMVLDVVSFDEWDTIQKIFLWKDIEKPNDSMVKRALRRNAPALESFMERFGKDIVTRQMIIDENPASESVWKVLVSAKEKNFVTPEVFQALVSALNDTDALELILKHAGPEIITAASVIAIADSRSAMDKLGLFVSYRISFDGLFTEEAFLQFMHKAKADKLVEIFGFVLEHTADKGPFLTKNVEEAALKMGDGVLKIVQK